MSGKIDIIMPFRQDKLYDHGNSHLGQKPLKSGHFHMFLGQKLWFWGVFIYDLGHMVLGIFLQKCENLSKKHYKNVIY